MASLDVWTYQWRRRTFLYVALVGITFGLLPLVTGNAFVSGAGIALSVVGAGVLVVGQRQARDRFAQPEDLSAGNRPPLPEPDGATVLSMDGRTAYRWPEADELLADSTRRLRFAWGRQRYVLPPLLAEIAYEVLLPAQRARGGLFNGPVVRQDDDLDVALSAPPKPVHVRRAGYFDLLCSNYVVMKKVQDRYGRLVVDGPMLVAGRANKLLSLRDSRLANSIGISTLAVTSEGGLVYVRQSRFAQSEANKAAPSGSGSFEPRDLAGRGRRAVPAKGDLRAALVRGMQRELREEANLDRRLQPETRLTGYFRWYDKGAKPEYTGLTLLDLNDDALHGREVRRVEREWVYFIRVIPLSSVDWRELLATPDDAAQILSRALLGDRGTRNDEPSFPLLMCVRNAACLLRNPARQGDAFVLAARGRLGL